MHATLAMFFRYAFYLSRRWIVRAPMTVVEWSWGCLFPLLYQRISYVYKFVMAISEMAISFLIRCKGTTKNAHTQVKRAFFWKIIDLSIEYVHLLLVGSSLTLEYVEEYIQKAKPYFSKKCERRWSMGCIVRTYFRGNWQSQGGVRSTTKCTLCEAKVPSLYCNNLYFFRREPTL